MGKCKFWIALSENPRFTEKDGHVFRVLYKDQSGDRGFNLEPLFVDSDDLESARKALHAFVDARVDHLLHMGDLLTPKKEDISPQVTNNARSPQRSISIGIFKEDGGEPTLGLE